ncbi:CBS domain-containing protein [Nostoc punctiforme UO1]|uniref:CBS domain-containing protein n=1 Tax=Nostoc punctiforme TaxID=272131 RepID=UPI0030B1FC2E
MPSLYTTDLPSLEQVIECSPLTVLPNTPLTDVIALMNPVSSNTVESASNFSSCVLVVEEKKLLGIFTLRDIVRLTGAEVDLSRVLISEVMTQPVISFTLDDAQNALTPLTLMRQHHIRHLPVVDEQGQLLGLITPEKIRQIIQPAHLLKLRYIKEVMVTDVTHALPTTSILQLSQMMSDRRISCVVIVSPQETGLIPVGMISEKDILKVQLQGLDTTQTQAQAVMSTPVLTISSTESLWVVHQLMQERGVRRLVVVGEQGQLQGLVTQTNLLQVLDPLEIVSVIQALQAKILEQAVQLCQFNQQLEQEVKQRRQAEKSLRQSQQELELQVAERTAQLVVANARLQQEIEERKQSEAAFIDSEQRLQAIIDNSPAVIYVKDMQGQHILVNSEFERLTHLPREQVKNKTDYEIFSADIAQALSKNDQKVLTSVTPLQSEEILQFDDGLHTYLSVKFPLCHSDGQPYAICGISTDITEKKQIEQQFYRTQRLESVGTLASGIAHDLNNVFTPMRMISELLPFRCKNVDAQTQELFKTLENCSKRGADLVKQILTFARGTEGKHILLQPEHLLKELVKVIKQTFLQSIEIVANIPTNTLWMVQADPTQLEQVFMNLAVNARDAMPNGGTLTITAENRMIDQTYAQMNLEAQAGSYIVVTFSDTGTGIPPEIEERIFEPFFTTKEVGKGTGLGLSTVSGIVKNHGGFIEVATRVGQGTKFQIFLPKAEGTTSEITTEAKLPRGKGELILVIDDEAVIQQITQQTLADYNYKTFVANDGIEAIALYAQYKRQISVVLLDMLMPNMDGLTAILALRTMNPNVKIIANSGLPNNEQKAIEAGADKFLYKPYTAKDLLTTLSDVIGD